VGLIRLTRTLVVAISALLLSGATRAQDAPPADPPVIEHVTGDLYMFRANAGVSVFLVTPDGIIMADPLGRLTARPLESALAERFPGRPVRFVVHTTHRFDRADGASRFDRDAEIVAHRSFNDRVSGARRALSDDLLDLDTNRDGTLEAGEVAGDHRAADLLAHDDNRNGRVTPDELYRFVVRPEREFDSARTIELGGRATRLIAVSAPGADALIVLHFTNERRLFVRGYPNLTASRPAKAPALRDVAIQIRRLAALEFDSLMTGDGTTIVKADVVALDRYLTDLRIDVREGFDRGQTLDELQSSRIPDADTATPFYAQRRAHIADFYRHLSASRIALAASPSVNALSPNAAYCLSYVSCERDRLVPGMTVSAIVSYRRWAATVEASFEAQSFTSRTSTLHDDAWAHRETTASFMFGRSGPVARPRTYTFSGGVSVVRVDSDGISRRKQVFATLGGIRALHFRDSRLGVTGGVDVNLGSARRFSVVLPLRVTYSFGEPGELRPNQLSLRTGVGLRLGVYRSAN
jgi:hypothetical protein